MPLIKIDGQEFECKTGQTVWSAAREAGIDIPNYCYHPGLSVAGNCRICLVEVQGMPKLTIGCATQVFEAPPPRKVDGKFDMVVMTDSPKVRKARESVMEFLLANHPLDCPICDQAGECKLQEYSFEHGKAESRMTDQKVLHDKRVQLGPNVIFDGDRCIKCTRCVRFCDEVTKTGELGLIDRGQNAVIGTYPGRELDNAYSVCTVDLCPVGALTFEEFRFASRVWFLRESDNLCLGCARGCSINVATKAGEVYRFTPRHNAEVNQWWMCDEGRLGFKALQPGARPVLPLFKASNESPAESISPEGALAKLAARPDLSRATPDQTVIVGSMRAPLEEQRALAEFATALFPGLNVLAPVHEKGQDDNLLIRRDKTPNRKGAELAGFKPVTGALKPADLKEKKLLLVVREDLFEECATPAEKDALKKAIEAVPLVIVLDDRDNATAAHADLFLPITHQVEHEGIYINCQGLAQKTTAALPAPAGVRPAPEWLAGIAAAFGKSADANWLALRARALAAAGEGVALRIDAPRGPVALPVGVL